MSFFNDASFFEAWRFEKCPDLMKEVRSGRITFFDKAQSKTIWSMFVSQNENHLMAVNMDQFLNMDRYDVDFSDKKSANKLFSIFNDLSGYPEIVFLFFSEKYLCATPFFILQEYWNHLFLPSDETTIVITAKNSHFLFSFEERFFIATR
jgi:hypothetical protein